MNDGRWNGGYEAIVQFLGLRAGLSFRPNQRESLIQSIDRAMELADQGDTHSYLQLLHVSNQALDDLLIQTTVGETYFFREPGQYQIIADLILPDIIEHRGPGHKLRIWSAGCATGEEPYSLAMLLHRRGLSSRATVLGTDISRESLAAAERAVYREWSLRGKGKSFSAPYLTLVDGQYAVNPEIKKSVQFEYLNLALDNYPSTVSRTRNVDLILCRNVMIYFDRQTVRSVVERLHRSLADGGWLVTAASDPPIHDYDLFDFVPTEHGLMFRKANTAALESLPLDLAFPKDSAPAPLPDDEQKQQSQLTDDQQLDHADRALAAGDFGRAIELSKDLLHLDEGVIIHIKALANQNLIEAEKTCEAQAGKRPLSKELHYLHAILLMDLNRHRDAADALRRVIYLDRSLALVHFSLGVTLRTLGDIEGAQRAFRNALQICEQASSPDDLVPLGEDEKVGDLRSMTRIQLDVLERSTGADS